MTITKNISKFLQSDIENQKKNLGSVNNSHVVYFDGTSYCVGNIFDVLEEAKKKEIEELNLITSNIDLAFRTSDQLNVELHNSNLSDPHYPNAPYGSIWDY